MPEYCFVLGCDRSGTTALTRLLHSHPAVVVGMERYKNRLSSKELARFGPALFERERFLDFQPEDTNITPEIKRFRTHYELAAQRLADGNVRYLGDKLVAKTPLALALKAQFPAPKVVFIYRDLLRVASSFCVRARNPNDTNWPEDRTHETALARWNEGFAAIDAFNSAPGDGGVFLVRYENMFNGDERTCSAMFAFLGLDVTPEVTKQFHAATANWAEHESKPLALSDQQIASLEAQLDREMLRRFDAEFEAQLALYTPT
jgi:hypothetical protein